MRPRSSGFHLRATLANFRLLARDFIFGRACIVANKLRGKGRGEAGENKFSMQLK